MNATLTLTHEPAHDAIDVDHVDDQAAATLPTTTISAPRGTTTSRRRDDYADVLEMFHHLARLEEGTTTHQRHRDRII